MTDDTQTPPGKAYDRNDDMKTPTEEGQSPRPASEPRGSEGSSKGTKTATDPSTGAPNDKRET